jgi:hypothetical protein
MIKSVTNQAVKEGFDWFLYFATIVTKSGLHMA